MNVCVRLCARVLRYKFKRWDCVENFFILKCTLYFIFSSGMKNIKIKEGILDIIFAIYFSGSFSSKLSVIYCVCLCEAQN